MEDSSIKKTEIQIPSSKDWKNQIKPEDVSGAFLQESSFSVLFPQYRQKYIQEVHGYVKKKLMEYGIKLEMNLLQGSLTVRTTKKTWDPYAIIKARDVIKLISRSVPYQQALRLLDDNMFCEVVKIRSLVRNKERFIKRRQRLIGPNGDTLKALQLLTQCYILVQGGTVCIIGHFKQIKTVEKIIIDTMQNIHPVYHIKQLMIKRELMKDEKMKTQNWDRFLPKFKQVKQQKKKQPKRPEKQYETFPPQPVPRKEDLLIQTGEYFLNQKEKKQRHLEAKRKKQQRKREQKEEEDLNQAKELKQQIKRQKQKASKREGKKKKEETVDELKQKFLTQPIKKISF